MKNSKLIGLLALLTISSLISVELMARGGGGHGGGHGGGGRGGRGGGRSYGHGGGGHGYGHHGGYYGRGGYGWGGWGWGVGAGLATGAVIGSAAAGRNTTNVIYAGDPYYGPDYEPEVIEEIEVE